MRTEIVELNAPLTIALMKAIEAACKLPDHEERRALVKELTKSLMYYNNPLVSIREST